MISWPKTSSQSQNFCLPSTVIYYISKNPPTEKCYHKLIKSCKHFFEKNPVIIVDHVHDGKIFCSKNIFDCSLKNEKCCVDIDVNKLTSKIWITTEFMISEKGIQIQPLEFLKKLYRCENVLFYLWFCRITLEEFKLYASKFQDFFFDNSSIIDEDRSNVLLEKVIEVCPNFKRIHHSGGFNATTATIKNITKLKVFNYAEFSLFHIPEIFVVDDILAFIKTHKNTKFWLNFEEDISEEYKAQLDAIIDMIIQMHVCKCIVSYTGQNEEKLKLMKKHYHYS